MIVKTDKEEYSFYKHLSLIIPKSFAEKINKTFTPPAYMIEENIKSIKKPVTIAQLKKNVADAESLTFGTTQNCNLRCLYCVYGGYYSYRRTHSSKKMELDTYIKAINLFYELVNSPLRTNRNGVSIGFYGGEPLLEFNNLLHCIEYAEQVHKKSPRKFPLNFTITTNGVLLKNEKAKKLIEKDFMIDISLDGPEFEHDKFRLKPDGSGTFAEIIENIEYIKAEFPDFFCNKIRFYVTLHPFHDIEKLEDFFLSRTDLFTKKNVSFAWVSLRYLRDDLLKIWYEKNLSQAKSIEMNLDKSKWVYRKLIMNWLEFLFENSTQNIANKSNFTGTCNPGKSRIFVDVDGNIHICERISEDFPIGNVYTGFDFKRIKKVLKDWNNQILKVKCWDCSVWWLCKCCFANRTTSNKFELNLDECNRFFESSLKSCKEFLKVLEAEDESKNYDTYFDINHYLDSL